MDGGYDQLAVDLDGTLLNSESRVSQRNIKALHAAHEAGIRIIFATGRRWYGTRPILDLIGLPAPVILNSGAQVRNYPAGRVVQQRPIPLESARAALRLIYEFGEEPLVYDNALSSETIYIPRPPTYQGMLDFFKTCRDSFGIDPVKSGPDLDFEPVQISLRGDEDRLRPLLDGITGLGLLHIVFASFPGIYGWMADLHHPEATKASALDWLCAESGRDPGRLLAMGDNINDLEMLEFAGLGLAMENAAPEVRRRAQETAPSNDDDGVAWAVERFMLHDAPSR